MSEDFKMSKLDFSAFTESMSKVTAGLAGSMKINIPNKQNFDTNYRTLLQCPPKNPMIEKMEKQNELQKESSDSLKSLVDINIEISNYNRELVHLNEKILNKINSLDDTLLFLNSSFIDKSEKDKEQDRNHNALLLELVTIMDNKDENKLKQFISGIAGPVGTGLIVEYLKIKLGLSK